MDYLNKFTNQASGNQGNKPQGQQPNSQQQTQQSGSSGGSSFMDKLHGMAGGGPESEKKEDGLDKGAYHPNPLTFPRENEITSLAVGGNGVD